MVYIAIGVLGFAAAFAFDWASLKHVRIFKQLAGLVSLSLLIYATIMVCHNPIKLELPVFARIIGACLLAIFLCLLIYSLFIELPFRGTYTKQGAGGKLISTGTYALVRHPGVIWLAFVFLALALLYPSPTLFLALVIWLAINVIYVTVQDKYFFPKMFPHYQEYQKQTPFLIPTKQSFFACLKTFRFPTRQTIDKPC
jgi:protein-S-isoprenylcysteine O-methyltransferase Ste14